MLPGQATRVWFAATTGGDQRCAGDHGGTAASACHDSAPLCSSFYFCTHSSACDHRCAGLHGCTDGACDNGSTCHHRTGGDQRCAGDHGGADGIRSTREQLLC